MHACVCALSCMDACVHVNLYCAHAHITKVPCNEESYEWATCYEFASLSHFHEWVSESVLTILLNNFLFWLVSWLRYPDIVNFRIIKNIWNLSYKRLIGNLCVQTICESVIPLSKTRYSAKLWSQFFIFLAVGFYSSHSNKLTRFFTFLFN